MISRKARAAGMTRSSFPSRAAAERGLRCKVHDGRLVILDEEAAEAQGPAVEIRRVAIGDEDLALRQPFERSELRMTTAAKPSAASVAFMK